MYKKSFIFLVVLTFGYGLSGFTQPKKEALKIDIVTAADGKKATITADGKPFTELIFTDTLEKHFLYPIHAPNGEIITRGFPYAPRRNEATDHPHHVGLWLNYENVNGLDFWNNSPAIPAERKDKYGSIKSGKILKAKGGKKKGEIKVNATWVNNKNQVLLDENTTFYFSAEDDKRIIDRITTLAAKTDVTMADVKDGMLGLRLGRALEMPSNKQQEFTDDKGNVTVVESNIGATGNYITSEGKEGDDAWGTRAQWCMLYGKVGNDSTSVLIIDHPRNLGYPTYWHARGYGLFSANPLGQKAFSDGKEVLNFSMKQGQSVTFRYRVVVASGQQPLQKEEINLLSGDFYQTVR